MPSPSLLVPSSNSVAANDLLDLQPAFQQPLPVSTTANTWGGEISASLGISTVHVLIRTLFSQARLVPVFADDEFYGFVLSGWKKQELQYAAPKPL